MPSSRGMKIIVLAACGLDDDLFWRPVLPAGRPQFQANVPWTNKKVRQLNMAVNRQEILATIFAGKGTLAYVSGWLPISEGWNPEWEKSLTRPMATIPPEPKSS